MKLEDKFDFDTALEVDNEVWKVFPKIQAREIKTMLKAKEGIEDLKHCLTTGFELKGFVFTVENVDKNKGFDIVITSCPWHTMIAKSHRAHLSAKVGDTICRTEYSTWAAEFGDNIIFAFDTQKRICAGGQECVLHFTTKSNAKRRQA